MKFKVIRAHFGDKSYQVGDEREAELADVQHLIGKVLEGVKVERAVENKMQAAPSNKSKSK